MMYNVMVSKEALAEANGNIFKDCFSQKFVYLFKEDALNKLEFVNKSCLEIKGGLKPVHLITLFADSKDQYLYSSNPCSLIYFETTLGVNFGNSCVFDDDFIPCLVEDSVLKSAFEFLKKLFGEAEIAMERFFTTYAFKTLPITYGVIEDDNNVYIVTVVRATEEAFKAAFLLFALQNSEEFPYEGHDLNYLKEVPNIKGDKNYVFKSELFKILISNLNTNKQ